MENKIKLPTSGLEVVFVEYIEAWILMDLAQQKNATEFLLENLIVSINGKTENKYETIRKMRFKDFQAIDDHISTLIKKEKGEKETEKK